MRELAEGFVKMVEELEAEEPRVSGLLEALRDSEPTVSVRVNPGKGGAAVAEGGRQVAWSRGGYYLESRPAFTLDVEMHQGRYYVQDASSMIIGRVVAELTEGMGPLVYLDACAAPGGKTTAAIDALPEGSLVVANEFDYRRAEILRENVTKWGSPSVVVSRGDTARFRKLTNTFDVIAADVPCSGEGMMRKDAEAVAQWSRSLIEECVGRQKEIIDNLWGALKPGGWMIYSTCTFNRQENEQMVEYIMETYGAESVRMKCFEEFEAILPAIGAAEVVAARFMPHLTRGEGLFMAVVRKPGELKETAPGDVRKKNPKQAVKMPAWWPEGMELLAEGETVWGIDPHRRELIVALMKRLDVMQPGVEVATLKGRDMIPAQGVAMLRGGRLPAEVVRREVDESTALTYLRREAIDPGDDLPRGYVLLTYGGEPLGWVKNLGNRSNNLYPLAWRIRHL